MHDVVVVSTDSIHQTITYTFYGEINVESYRVMIKGFILIKGRVKALLVKKKKLRIEKKIKKLLTYITHTMQIINLTSMTWSRVLKGYLH